MKFYLTGIPVPDAWCLSKAKQQFVMQMKLITLLLTTILVQAGATGFSQQITLNAKNTPVEKVLRQIESQTDYVFFYNHDDLQSIHVNVALENATIQKTLEACFKDLPLSYKIIGKNIALKKKGGTVVPKAIDIVQPIPVAPELIRIQGTVKDEKGGALPGVSIIVKGTQQGATTNTEGAFQMDLSSKDVSLVFSFVGYETQEVAVGTQSSFTVVMKVDIKAFDDVVVVGYGSVKKSDLTGSVASINKKDLGDRQVSDIGSLIQGRAAGVDVSQGKIRVRGVTTFNNTDPLIVIDGFLGGNLATVNPNDIENIEVLKDASSTAIYGSRGANGVILITTKMGKAGPLKINASFYEGISQTPKKLDVLNANQYIDFTLNALNNSGIQPTPRLLSSEVRADKTDWQDAVFRTGKKRELNLDFSGGSENASFFLAMGYRYNQTITSYGPSSHDVYLRNKNSLKLKSWLRGGSNLSLSYNNNGGGYTPWNIDNMINFPTYMGTTDPNNPGGYSDLDRNTDLTGVYNPLAIAANNHSQNSGLNYQANIFAEIEPLKGLIYRIQAGVNGFFGVNQYSNDAYRIGGGSQTFITSLSKKSYYGLSPLVENYLTYTKTFGKHDLSAMIGSTLQKGASGGGIGVFGNNLPNLNIQNTLLAPTSGVSNDDYWKYAYVSFFGRLNYQFNNKYLLTVNFRTDGSPKFAPSNRWGAFPSVAVAWKLHEEQFVKNLNLFDQLKLRVGWGQSGNDAIGDFQYVSQVYTAGVYYPLGIGQLPVAGATVINNASNKIKWESTESTSIGADMAFFSNRFTATAEYFIKKTNDILFAVPTPVSLGYGGNTYSGSAVVNAASCVNKGFELQLGYQSQIGDLRYSFNGNYSYISNKVTSLGTAGQPFLSGVSRTDIGNPIGYFYGFRADGVFQTQQELDEANEQAKAKGFDTYQLSTTKPGDVRYQDLNGDGHIDWDQDRTNIGSPLPNHYYGLNVTLDYKGFDFNVFFQGIAGSKIYDGAYSRLRGGTQVLNQLTYVLDRWQSEENPGNGIVPRAVIGDPAQNDRPSTLMLSSGNFMKVRQLSLGYSLPKPFAAKIGLERVRFYVSAYNFFTLSKYNYGYDPEVGGENLVRGIANTGSFPNPKSVVAGFQLGF